MIKENTYANIKEQNISNYVPAGEITHCYSVTFIKEKTYELFGKVIRKKTTSETMPFVFKSLDIAKDFCEVCPTIISHEFINHSNYNKVIYYTYVLLKNDRIIGYIEWDKHYTCNNLSRMEEGDFDKIFGPFNNDKIVGKFVKNIVLKTWIFTDSLDDIKFEKRHEYLSGLIKDEEPLINKETYNEWNFKLVEQ